MVVRECRRAIRDLAHTFRRWLRLVVYWEYGIDSASADILHCRHLRKAIALRDCNKLKGSTVSGESMKWQRGSCTRTYWWEAPLKKPKVKWLLICWRHSIQLQGYLPLSNASGLFDTFIPCLRRCVFWAQVVLIYSPWLLASSFGPLGMKVWLISLCVDRSATRPFRLIRIIIAWSLPSPRRSYPTRCTRKIGSSAHSPSLSDKHSSDLIHLVIVPIATTTVNHLDLLYRFSRVYSPPSVLILKRIDQIVEILNEIRARVWRRVRVQLSERIVDCLKVKDLFFHLFSPDLRTLIDLLELSLPSFIVDHELGVVVTEEGLEHSYLVFFARDSLGLERRHHEKFDEVVVWHLS